MDKITTQSLTHTIWSIDKKHSEINFTVYSSLFSKTKGRFNHFGGSILMMDDSISGADVNLWIDPNSLTTDNDDRDLLLKGQDFFDTSNHKIVTYKGGSLRRIGREFLYQSTGLLTIKNMTRVAKFEVDFMGEMKDPGGKQRIGFYVKGLLNRNHWNLGRKNLYSGSENLSINNHIIMEAKFQLTQEVIQPLQAVV